MKHLISAIAAVIAVGLAGCASTSQPDRTDYPTLTVLNPTPYVWDDKKSLALNVAKMAEPAGVGIGLEDSDKASDANTGRSTTGERVFGLALMGLAQGVYGMASDSVLTDTAEAAFKWKPTLVDLIPVSEVGSQLTPQAFVKLRTISGERITSTIKIGLPDTRITAIYTPKVTRWKENVIFIIDGSGCAEAVKFHSGNPDSAAKYLTRDYSRDLLEAIKLPSQYCQIASKLSVAGITKKDGVDHYIVTNELIQGQNFIVHMDERYPGYILIPEQFDVPSYDGSGSLGRTLYPHAVVFYKGKPQSFVKPN